ncbi:hypothetical protein MT325_m784R [Paramecium bursaria chlorella virus MT325]|uniref:Uncharacterized protein m784R n=1 Tax=Paramecium bursaria Chlorella virus MT325 TaxID=346932 RepID=A7IVG4_PBCVM|nr:hypothetical protein MT325_m784R [Paramecium bursaria chlorella virus MT325]
MILPLYNLCNSPDSSFLCNVSTNIGHGRPRNCIETQLAPNLIWSGILKATCTGVDTKRFILVPWIFSKRAWHITDNRRGPCHCGVCRLCRPTIVNIPFAIASDTSNRMGNATCLRSQLSSYDARIQDIHHAIVFNDRRVSIGIVTRNSSK